MEDTLITFETAKLAKIKGFKWETLDSFYKMTFEEIWKSNSREEHGKFIDWNTETISVPKNNISRPTQSLLQKWLREVHNIAIDVNTHFKTSTGKLSYGIVGFRMKQNFYGDTFSEGEFDTYEEALEEGLQRGLKLLPNKE